MSIAYLLNRKFNTDYQDIDLLELEEGDIFAEIEYCVEHWIALSDPYEVVEEYSEDLGKYYQLKARCLEDGREIEFGEREHTAYGLNLFKVSRPQFGIDLDKI